MQATMQGTKRSSAVPMVLVLVAYLALAFVIMPQFSYLYYKDEVSYLAAAERYALGDFAAAPNSLWGPLISWLLAVPLALGAKPMLAMRIVSLACGMALLLASKRLIDTLGVAGLLRLAFFVILVPFVVYFTIVLNITSDIALTALLIAYFSIVFDPHYASRRYVGAICGVLGGFCYFAKGFGLPFFLAHFTVVTVVHYLANEDKADRARVLRHAATGLAIFAFLATCWMAALHQKYGHWSPGMTGRYNHEILGPGVRERPVLVMGFAAPPPVTTVSIWEDPEYLYSVPVARACCLKPWSAFDSTASFKHQVGLFKLNAGRTIIAFFKYSVLWPVIIAGALLFWLAPLRRKTAVRMTLRQSLLSNDRLAFALALVTMAIYVAPYTMVFSDERFFWPILIVMVAIGLRLLARLFHEPRFAGRKLQIAILTVFTLSFLVLPAVKFTGNQEARRATASFARQIEPLGLTGKRFASLGDYGASVIMGYHVRAKYYGAAAPGMSDDAVAADLRRLGVDYYFVWDAPLTPRPGMTLLRTLKAEHRKLGIYGVTR